MSDLGCMIFDLVGKKLVRKTERNRVAQLSAKHYSVFLTFGLLTF